MIDLFGLGTALAHAEKAKGGIGSCRRMPRRPESCFSLNPQPNPQKALSYRTLANFGSLRGL